MHYLGPLRLFLAISVAAFHIWTPLFPDTGRHAVMGFFAISGFLITMIANEVYRDRPGAFLLNRALRIYPTYWVCLILALATAVLFPRTIAEEVWLTTPWPSGPSGWLTNIAIFEIGSNGRTITQTWSLYIELIMYLVVGLATFRSLALTLIGFVVSIGWAFYGMFHMAEYPFYFYPMGTAFVFFSGSLAYFASKRIRVPRTAALICLALYGVSMFGLPHFMRVEQYAGPIPHFFLLISVASVAIILTALPTFPKPSPSIEAAARLAGDFSYPLFLLHLACAVPVVSVFGPSRPVAFFGSLILAAPISYCLIRAENSLEGIRSLIRMGSLGRLTSSKLASARAESQS
ncbi:Peptidoglycan/LPS O-acetylase OafA/YrhL, contains acyltransferase and SGNH-hydrolase domains [Bradyrhizobium sp. NFR13]|uniref:acyltransferase family protein n=1 Tax=Bradyrhizobium sp. NFR13 TaxID=1566285 RepID=UPI0008E50894|nr:Peptidoglycan/LPS O-acetylase OafA/YrhL, contains acyltransferase and SGNH-hydrolase domains [Bradyrhizobium sp. NFR13]